MNTNPIEEFIEDRDWCLDFMCRKMPRPLALRKLMALDKAKAQVYGSEFYIRFCNYRNLHKTILYGK